MPYFERRFPQTAVVSWLQSVNEIKFMVLTVLKFFPYRRP